MDTTDQLGSTGPILKWTIIRPLALLIMVSIAVTAETPKTNSEWAPRLYQHLLDVDEAHLGELGVYVKDLNTGVAVSLRGDESWYIASGIKVPVAIAVLRNVEQGEYSLDTKVHLVESDYVDGAGQTNWQGPGSQLPISYLLEQMLTVSDNTATDMLIRLVGLDQVNDLVRELVPNGFGTITTLADVRRYAYSGFHPDAFRLTGKDFFVLRKQSSERLRLEALANILGVDMGDFAMTDLDSAFAAYYTTNLNGAQLTAYGDLLEALVDGRALRPESTDYLMNLLFNVITGDRRIKAGLPGSVAFAHKTGTQHLRACDLGVAIGENRNEGTRVIIAACNRGFLSVSAAEASLQAVGRAVFTSGVLDAVHARSSDEQVN